MFDKLQRKFIKIISLAILLVNIFLCVIALGTNYLSLKNNEKETLKEIYKNEGKMPFDDKHDREAYYTTRYFVLRFNENGDISLADLSNVSAVKEEDLNKYVDFVLNNKSNYGLKNNYRFYKDRTGEDRYIAVFLDVSKDLEQFKKSSFYVLVSAFVCTTIVIVVSVLCSKRAVWPYLENQRKQKEFITDASHELKTPIASLKSSLEVLRSENGDNKWLNIALRQTDRLTLLVNELVKLNKLDESMYDLKKEDFNLSNMLREIELDFNELASIKGLEFKADIEDNLVYRGNEELIKQLVFILLDNALKYGKNDRPIELSLKKYKKDYLLSCINSCDNLDDDLDRLFDRFYRSDKSHNSKTGGFGIGLALAKNICEAHNGDIRAIKLDDKTVKFEAVLS